MDWRLKTESWSLRFPQHSASLSTYFLGRAFIAPTAIQVDLVPRSLPSRESQTDLRTCRIPATRKFSEKASSHCHPQRGFGKCARPQELPLDESRRSCPSVFCIVPAASRRT